jgi:hypothetical protein
MVKSQTTQQQSTRTIRQQCTNSPGMRGSKTDVVGEEAERERRKRKFEEGSGDQCGVCKMNVTPGCLQTG